ncbi:MAG: hypothetical protein D6737_11525 [Chloroflexi bacterium]|nr:MAG: hypothetical protein CUN54_03425 [Phototrophicales bacterium]RMF79444.1 MAG: hypothetical protein D6737_11525 [Chloroflexota bacterium]
MNTLIDSIEYYFQQAVRCCLACACILPTDDAYDEKPKRKPKRTEDDTYHDPVRLRELLDADDQS